MTDATLQLIIKLKDEASGILKNIQGSIGGLADAAKNTGQGITSFLGGALQFATGGLIQKGIEGIASSFGALKDGMIGGNAEFERYETQFGVLLGGADAAKQRLGELAKFGATTPFELPEVVRADKILQSFGLHSQDAAKRFGFAGADIRTIAGDVASGTGAQFEEISGYIGKFASGATGEAIARFQELGIVTKTQLADMGLQFDKGGSLIIGSQEDLDKATGILLQGMKSKYGGMMAAQSATFEGMVSNLQDWSGQTMRIIGAPIFDVLKTNLGGLLAWLPTIQPQIEAFAQVFAGRIGEAMTFVQAQLPGVITWFTGLYTTLLAGWEAAQPWIAGLVALGNAAITAGMILGRDGLGAAIDFLGGVLRDASAYFGPLIQQAIDPIWQSIVAAAPMILQAAMEWGQALLDWISPFIPPLLAALGDLINQAWAWVQGQAPIWLEQLMVWGQSLIDWLAPFIPPLLAKLGELAGQLWTWIQEQAPGWIEKLKAWGQALIDWIAPFIPPLLEEFGKLVGQLWQYLADQAPVLYAKLGEWQNQFLTWIGTNAPTWGTEFGKLVGSALSALIDGAPGMITALGTWIGTLGTWAASDGASGFSTALNGIAEGLGNALEEIGKQVGPRLLAGIQSAASGIGNWANGLIGGGGAGGSTGQPTVPQFANGVRNFGGGLALVGERGPELVGLPSGSSVFPSGSMGGGGVTIGSLIIQAASDPYATAQAVREELQRIADRNYTSGVV
jgi:phage-related protein